MNAKEKSRSGQNCTGDGEDLTPRIDASDITQAEFSAYAEFREANKVTWFCERDRSNFIHGYRAFAALAASYEIAPNEVLYAQGPRLPGRATIRAKMAAKAAAWTITAVTPEKQPWGVKVEAHTPPVAPIDPGQAVEMSNRFLGWKLPREFSPDSGISFTPHAEAHCWPTGTNLLNASQAKSMFEYCLAGLTAMRLPFEIKPSEIAGLMRFHDCGEDGQDHDVDSETIKALACLGLLHHKSAGRYEETSFGMAVLQGAFSTRA